MSERDFATEIDTLASRRCALWCNGYGEGAEIARIGSKLADLYEEKRAAAASAGSKQSRKRIIKRAKTEKELDRLMGAA